MKKSKVILIILIILLALGTIFFTIDYGRTINNKNPLFCIRIATYLDGGTTEYLGLGYKVIRFNKMLSSSKDYTEMRYYRSNRIGPIFMNYSDFYSDYNSYEELRDNLLFYYENHYGPYERIVIPDNSETVLGDTFYAKITEIHDNYLLVDGLDINDINFRGKFSISLSEKPAFVWHGTSIEKSKLSVGNTISITFSGDILESSPAQINTVYRIIVLDDEI